MFEKHQLLDTKTAIKYIKEKSDYFGKNEVVYCREIGDGNINYVFRLCSDTKSLILKQSDRLLRSSGRPLDLKRSYIESEILKIYSSYTDIVPKVYFYDEVMCIIAMEDISSYKNMREELMSFKKFPNFAKWISDFFSKVYIPTTDMVLSREEKKKNVIKFTNIELCDISEDLVFTEPYYDYKKRNIITKGNEEFVRKNLYENELLKSKVGYLRNNFMNNSQALIHGDLHTGSIFINEENIKIIDPEFAFYGPIAYDIGNVIGNLIISYFYAEITRPDKNDFLLYLRSIIKNIPILVKFKLMKSLNEYVTLPLYNETYKKYYIKRIMRESMGYAATEMIRRTVGDSKVKEITSVEDLRLRIKLERKIISTAVNLIMNNI